MHDEKNKQPFRSEIILELHVPDFKVAHTFYTTFGFAIEWMEKGYMVLRKQSQALCFYGGDPTVYNHSYFGNFPSETKRGYGVEIVIFQDDIETFYERIKNDVPIISPLTLKPWGYLDFRVEDPFGYYLRISEPYDSVENRGNPEQTREMMTRYKISQIKP